MEIFQVSLFYALWEICPKVFLTFPWQILFLGINGYPHIIHTHVHNTQNHIRITSIYLLLTFFLFWALGIISFEFGLREYMCGMHVCLSGMKECVLSMCVYYACMYAEHVCMSEIFVHIHAHMLVQSSVCVVVRLQLPSILVEIHLFSNSVFQLSHKHLQMFLSLTTTSPQEG